MQVGIVGLGKMGANIRERLRRAGHTAIGFDLDPTGRDVDSLDALVAALAPPRVVWVMVPAGPATSSTLRALLALCRPGDVLVDGGNSRFRDSIQFGEEAAAAGIGFLDCGTSGGVWGLDEGYCLMVGGDRAHVDVVRPILDSLAPSGFAHAGPVGAGHYAKMVHNGIEYGLMQAYAEGYELLGASELPIDVDAVIGAWRSGSVVRSWLLDLLARALEAHPGLADIGAWADDSGEGRWAVQEATERAVPVPVLSAALYARFASRQDASPAMKVIAALREQFGGHPVRR